MPEDAIASLYCTVISVTVANLLPQVNSVTVGIICIFQHAKAAILCMINCL